MYPPSSKRFASGQLVVASLHYLHYLYRQDAMKCYTHFSTNSRDVCGDSACAARPFAYTVTSVPATLDVHPTDIALTACMAAQTQVTVANTGGVPFT
jgi:hypothetical protein